jgi:hypothetical protein
MLARRSFILVAMTLAFGACKRNPIDRLTDPVPSGAVSGSSGVYIIYDDELKTGGGLGFIPGGENQSINLAEPNPIIGHSQIRYTWNGGDIYSSTLAAQQHLFAGFSLLVTPDFTTFDSATGKNLNATTNTPYTKLKFFVRGAVSENTTLRIEGPDDGSGGITPVLQDISLTSSWQEVTMSIPSSTHFANVKVFMTVSLQYSQAPRTTNPGQGGTIFLDQIRYEQ